MTAILCSCSYPPKSSVITNAIQLARLRVSMGVIIKVDNIVMWLINTTLVAIYTLLQLNLHGAYPQVLAMHTLSQVVLVNCPCSRCHTL